MPNYLHIIILYMIKKFQGERSIYAIFHMLQGKKSSQTIQDAHLFGLTNLYGTMPQFTRIQLSSIVENLVSNAWIHTHGKSEVFILTLEGEQQLKDALPIPARLNGWKYQNIAHHFWGRLNLLIQTLSYIIHKETRFYPVQRDVKIQQAVKQLLQINHLKREEMATQMFRELVHNLERQSIKHRQIFVSKLTGFNCVGQTFEQIGQNMNLDVWYVRLLFLECIHTMIEEVERNAEQYRWLATLMKDLHQQKLTHSTQLTLQLINEGQSLLDISNIRQLKANTIEDHIVEIVLADRQFPIHNYVPDRIEKKICDAINQLQTKQLKVIKQWLGDAEISFFQIRLVLAKVGEEF